MSYQAQLAEYQLSSPSPVKIGFFKFAFPIFFSKLWLNLSVIKKKITILVLALVALFQVSKAQDFNVLGISQPIYPAPVNLMYPPEIIIDFTYVPEPEPYYVHFYIILPQGSTQPIDLLEGNIFLPDFQNERHLQMPIDLSMYNNFYLLGQPIDTFRLGVIFSDTLVPSNTLENAFFVENYLNVLPTYNVYPSWIDFGQGGILYDTSFLNKLQKVLSIPPNQVNVKDTTRSVVRGCNMPNLNLDSSKHNIRTEPGYAGDWNACVPVSCANSFEWLEARHPLELDTGLSHRDKLKEFSKLMNRDTNEGVYTIDAIKGKLAFVDKYKLPVHFKFQSFFVKDSCVKSPDSSYVTRHCADNKTGPSGEIDFDFMFSEMAKGEDVEVFVTYKYTYTCPGKPDSVLYSAHALTLVDIVQSGNKRSLHFKDDSLQGAAGGLRESIVNYDTNAHGEPYIPNWTKNYNLAGGKTLNITTFVTDVLSESLDTSVKFISSINDFESKMGLTMNLLGNPSKTGKFSVEIETLIAVQKGKIQIMDQIGKEVYLQDVGSISKGTHTFEIKTKLSPGIYFVNYLIGANKVTKKLMVH